MENAADALKMAGSVLIFILALSLIVPLFTQARVTSDAIMQYVDRQGQAEGAGEEGEDLFYYIGNEDAEKFRYVGIETVIPTIYQSLNEDFKVVFCDR